MNTMTKFFFVVLALAGMTLSPAFADGEVCSASDKSRAEGALSKAEAAEKAGRTLDAYRAARSLSMLECAAKGVGRRDGLIERSSKKLGMEAEKAGRFGEAFEYFSTPLNYGRLDDRELNAAADRNMLKYAKSKPEDYKVVSQAAEYFKGRDNASSLNQVRGIARQSGDEALAKEEKDFTSNRKSLGTLEIARRWLEIAGDSKRADSRAVQRGDTLLAEGTVSSIERAMQYYSFAGSKSGEKKAQERARKLGEDAARKGDHSLAARFYALSGDEAKAAAVEKQKEKAETKRQDKFKQDQKSLEKELGL